LTHNFNAGPSILPREVFEEASKAILNFNDTGLSILEIGHRTPLFEAVLDEARQLLRELMKLNADKEILFLHGGASTQFFQVPMNLLNEDETAAYLDCGIWGIKSIKEAKNFGNVAVVASSKDKGYTYIPKDYIIPSNVKYFHYTTNNTIEGTEVFEIPKTNVPIVADMSSDILSREMDFNRFALIYAGAQKNIGPSGATLVIINEKLLGKVSRPIPTILDYRNHIREKSMLNTPPVFAVYVAMLTLRWLKNKGGVAAIEKENDAKAKLFYDTLDSLPVFRGPVAKEDRSKMNACFVMPDQELEKKFMAVCKENNFYGIKGHRTTGGFRISMYNALQYESVIALTDLMKEFEQKHG